MIGVVVVSAVALSAPAFLPTAATAAPSANGGRAEGDGPQVQSLVSLMDGFKWGQSPEDVINAHNKVGGIFDKDYDPLLAKAQPGVQQKALEADRDNKKLAVQHGYIEFKDTPTGYDATPLKSEYSYRNKESVLVVDRAGKKRFFFFIGAPARLWKIYDEIPLDETSGLGRTFQDAITKLQGALGVAGRVRAADPAKGIMTTTVDWQDGNTHLRALDRRNLVAIVLEERTTLANIDRLRAVKPDDPLAMDPSISAITRGGISDPNAHPTGSASASAGKKTPAPAGNNKRR